MSEGFSVFAFLAFLAGSSAFQSRCRHHCIQKKTSRQTRQTRETRKSECLSAFASLAFFAGSSFESIPCHRSPSLLIGVNPAWRGTSRWLSLPQPHLL